MLPYDCRLGSSTAPNLLSNVKRCYARNTWSILNPLGLLKLAVLERSTTNYTCCVCAPLILVRFIYLFLFFFPDLFGTLDPFGSSTFSTGSSSSSSNTSAGFADFSHMLKPRDPFEGRASWLPDYQKVPKVKTLSGDRDLSQIFPKALFSS